MKTKDEIEFEQLVAQLGEFFDDKPHVRTADEIVAEELSKVTPVQRVAWEQESAAMLAEARARVARRRGPSERTQRAEERKTFLSHDDDERSDANADVPVEPEPALTAEDMEAMMRFLGDGPFVVDPWAGFAEWDPSKEV